MGSVNINAQGSEYTIYAEYGLINKFPEILSPYKGKHAAIITDTNVNPLYGEKIKDALQKSGLKGCEIYAFPAGEESKSNETLLKVYDFLFEQRITRSDVIISLGGGVVGDLTGYAGATFLRGVPVIQIPTTLLAQIDSSVGGKVAINVPQGKNMIGTFSQPIMVLSDLDFLQTLDNRQFLAGLAELIKYGCIFDADLFDVFEQANNVDALKEKLSDLVLRCCEIKADYVQRDPFDHDVRMELNFGHSLAHAIEKEAGYGVYLHGEAVSIGMYAAALWGEKSGISPEGTSKRVYDLLTRFEMPVQLPDIAIEQLAIAMMGDKKSVGDSINLIMLEEIGKAKIITMTNEDARLLVQEVVYE